MLPHVRDVNSFVGSSGGESALGGPKHALFAGQPFLSADDNPHENMLISTSVTESSLIRCYGRGEKFCGFVSLQLGNFDPTQRPHRAQPQRFLAAQCIITVIYDAEEQTSQGTMRRQAGPTSPAHTRTRSTSKLLCHRWGEGVHEIE
jgi:hypothetical protein